MPSTVAQALRTNGAEYYNSSTRGLMVPSTIAWALRTDGAERCSSGTED